MASFINLFLTELSQKSLIISIFVMVIMYCIIISQWSRFRQILFIKKYEAIQRVHEGEISRLGGLVIYTGLFVIWLLSPDGEAMSFVQCLLVSSLPLLFISLKEDLFHNTRATTRLFFMALSTVLFFLSYDISYPVIELPILGEWLVNSTPFSLLFFTFCVLIIMNGNNMIDGVNGLLPMTLLTQCCGLFYITYDAEDIVNMINLLYIFIPVIIFLFFNYPFGKIFLGDTGAYFLGFTISLLTIIIFGMNSNLSTWLAVLILFYPAFEVLFSLNRKLIEKKSSPMKPDFNHLHLKMFYWLMRSFIKQRKSNSLVMPCLSIIWGLPLFLVVIAKESHILIFISIVVCLVVYICLYITLPRVEK